MAVVHCLRRPSRAVPLSCAPRRRLNKPTPTIVRDASVRSRVSENLGGSGRSFACGSSAHHLYQIRWNTTLRLFAGISVIVGTENPTDCAIAATASRSRRPQVELRSRRLRSNAWLLGVVANPSRLYGP